MDFEDSGIESDPKINTEKETLQQHNEPIISFSPERCRFDSAQSSSRKSSTSFPISVADLQLDEQPPSSLPNNNCNSINNLQNLSKTTNNGVPSKTASIQQIEDHAAVNQPLFTNILSKQQQQLKQAYPFLHNQQQLPQAPPLNTFSLSSSTATALQGPAASLIISTNALSSTTSSASITSSNNKNRANTTFLPTKSSLDSPSISLMVNGAVLSANNINSTTNTTPTSSTSTTTALDLQKRLEKRIAQASAIAAAAAAAASSSSTTTTAATTSSTSLSSTTTAETKGNDSILLSDIISATGIANKAITTISPSASILNNATATSTSNAGRKNNGNQISFSPQKSNFFSSAASTSEQFGFQENNMPSSSPSLWESDPSTSSAIDLWENKVIPAPVIDDFPGKASVVADSFMDASQTTQVRTSHSQHQPTSSSINDIITSTGREKTVETGGGGGATGDVIAQLDLTCDSVGKTTSCTTSSTNTKGGVLAATSTCTGGGSASSNNNSNIPSVNKSNSSKNNSNKPKGNQSLRNNNNTSTTTSNVPGGGGGAASSSTSAACGGGGGGSGVNAATPEPLSSSASVITVVNASFDIRKVSALLPPQRLAIPSKSNPQHQSSHSANSTSKTSKSGGSSGALSSTNNSGTATVTFSSFGSNSGTSNPPTSAASSSSSTATVHKTSTGRLGSISETSCGGVIQPPPSGNGNIKTGSSNSSKLSTIDSEKKPLVQWDSDESEDELSFFPSTKRGVITDNLSIDNMSLSGEEEDLHLTPPRPLAKKCPCDPRTWLDRTDISSTHHHHGDPTRVISSKFSCIIC